MNNTSKAAEALRQHLGSKCPLTAQAIEQASALLKGSLYGIHPMRFDPGLYDSLIERTCLGETVCYDSWNDELLTGYTEPETEEISWGTHRGTDLLGAFIGWAQYNAPKQWAKFAAKQSDYTKRIFALLEDRREVPETEYVIEFLYEDLWRFMEEMAPDGTYFGSHPGDGSCFGFWADNEHLIEYNTRDLLGLNY